MPALTKTHRTETNCARISTQEKCVRWQDVFKDAIDESTCAGLVLKGMRTREGLTQKALAELLGIKTHHISEMEHGKRSIGKAMAHRLADIFKTGYRIFL